MSYNSITLILIVLLLCCFLNEYFSKLKECYMTSLLGQKYFALQMNMFYVHLLATQMRIPIDNFSGKVIIINLLV